MALSVDQRRALEDRARGLREEVSTLGAERDIAVDGASQEKADAKLILEVQRLERERDDAVAARDAAVSGGVTDAVALMEKAIREQEERDRLTKVESAEVRDQTSRIEGPVDTATGGKTNGTSKGGQ